MNKSGIRVLITFFVFIAVVIMAVRVYGWPGHGEKEAGQLFHEEEAVKEILFEQDHIFTSRDSFLHVDGSTVTISRSGTYLLKGRMKDGQVIVDAGEDGEVKLKLNGLSLSCSYGPAIYVKQAKKVRLRLKEGSENELIDLPAAVTESRNAEGEDSPETTAAGNSGTDGTIDEGTGIAADEGTDLNADDWKACIYARSDLNIKGDGSLIVRGNHRHGIFASKDLKIKSGTITVDAARQALHGGKSVTIEDGNISLTAGTDGIHSKGVLDITGGKVDIDAGKYGMYAFSGIHVNKESGESPVTVRHALSEAGSLGELEY